MNDRGNEMIKDMTETKKTGYVPSFENALPKLIACYKSFTNGMDK